MPVYKYSGDRKSTTCPLGATAVATTFGVGASAAADFPDGPRVFDVVGTGESILVSAGFGTSTWSSITRGVNGTTAAIIPTNAVILESIAANELTNFEQQGQELTLPDEVITGLTGSVQSMRVVGATTSGAPVAGAHLVGDAVLSLADAKWYVCTVAGTPGTFVTPGSSGGTVTSVALSVPGVLFSVSGSPITGSGTLALSLLTQNPNKVLAGPTSGADATPTVRALVAADIPAVNPSALTGSGTVPLAALTGITDTQIAAANKDGTAGTASLRTLGTGAAQAVAGNDARLSDTRTPTAGSVVDASVNASAAIAESKLSLASDTAAGTASRRTLGTGATQATAGNDSRLSDARTPTTHATSHGANGSDTLAWTTIHARGTHAARPAASSSNAGYTYAETDNGGGLYESDGATWNQIAVSSVGGGGTVTSVGLTVPTGLTVSPSSVTTSGTFAVTEDTQSANRVKAGPSSGGAATPTYRALVAADVPANVGSINKTGSTALTGAVTLTPGTNVTLTQSGQDISIAAGSGAITQIQKITLGSNGVFSFTSIPGTYNELILVIWGRLSTAGNAISLWRANSDSGANYEYQWIVAQAAFAQAANASATGFVANWAVGTGQAANHVGSARLSIPQYANTSFYKGFSTQSQYGDGSGGIVLIASGEWRNTAAITRLDSVDSYLTNSVAILYGAS